MARRPRRKGADGAGTAVASAIARVLARIDETADGRPPGDSIPTGFPSVDRVLGGGLRRGDLAVLGGDVGSGKSALALAIAVRAAAEGRSVVFYTGEMSDGRVAERILAIEGRAQVDDMRRGTLDDPTRASVGAAAVRLRQTRLVVASLPTGAEPLGADLATRRGAELAIVDPLQMLSSGRLPQDEELAAATGQLKRVAIDLDRALLVASHLPHLAARPDRRPQLDDFGALGAVKQHADVVLGLFREGMYDPARSLEGATELHILKNRTGPKAYADLYFYERWMRFEDLVDPDR